MARSGAERFDMGCRMFEAARDMVLSSFPDSLSEIDKKRMLFARFYNEALPTQVSNRGEGQTLVKLASDES